MSFAYIFNVCFKFICILGCVFQLQNICVSYFSFGTVTRNRFITPDRLSYPTLHMCFGYLHDMLEWESVGKKYGKVYPYDSNEGKLLWSNKLTVRDLFEFTPNVTFDRCRYRDAIGNNVILASGQTCADVFSVQKYIFQQYVCYALTKRKQESIDFDFIHSSLMYERELYNIDYSGKPSNVGKIRVTISDGNEMPSISRVYSPGFYKDKTENINLQISCHNFSNTLLGYPYDKITCAADGDHYECRDECLRKQTIKHLNRLPFAIFNVVPENIPLISDKQMKNITISKMYQKWYKFCDKSCPVYQCKYSYCLTLGQSAVKGSLGGRPTSSIRMLTPINPTTNIQFFPSLPLLDFIVYILSSLGTWFGLVIISCNPLPYVMMLYTNYNKRRMRRHDRRDLFLRRMRLRTRITKENYKRWTRNILKTSE